MVSVQFVATCTRLEVSVVCCLLILKKCDEIEKGGRGDELGLMRILMRFVWGWLCSCERVLSIMMVEGFVLVFGIFRFEIFIVGRGIDQVTHANGMVPSLFTRLVSCQVRQRSSDMEPSKTEKNERAQL